jgi:signal transduction histidine kinase
MGQGHLDHRVPVRADNDLGELASSINTMASDIEQMLDAKRQLLLGASHELRSPLTRAKVATQLIENPRQRELLEENLLEMEHLITDILESERMKSGHAVLELSNVDLIQLVESVVSEMQAEGVVVESPDTLPTLQLDETRITILLRNLISNALTHNGNTSPVKVALQQQGNAVLIAVCDSGPGIAPEHIEKLTEPFYRTDDSRTRSTGGFGLGLHLAKLIVEAHGGQLRIISSTTASGEFGGSTGTRVEVDLPVLGNR